MTQEEFKTQHENSVLSSDDDVRDLPLAPGIGQRRVGHNRAGRQIFAPVLPAYEAFEAPADFTLQFIDRDGQKMRVVRIDGILYKERV